MADMNRDLYVEEDNILLLGNDIVEIGFDPGLKGSICSIFCKRKGFQILRDACSKKLLFILDFYIKRNGGKVKEKISATNIDAENFSYSVIKQKDNLKISFNYSGFFKYDIRLIVDVSLEKKSNLFVFNLSLNTKEEGFVIYKITLPYILDIFDIGNPVPGESLAVGKYGEGYLFEDPFPVLDNLKLKAGESPDQYSIGVGEIHGMYPGTLQMQFMLYYNDYCGLYFATHDAEQNVKSFDVGLDFIGSKIYPVISMSHFPGEEEIKDFSLAYDTVLGVFEGDWYLGADIYKSWAEKQWWCKEKLQKRKLPAWFKEGFAVFEMSNYHYPEIYLNHSVLKITKTINSISRQTDVSILGLIFNWEREGAWTAPKGIFPPREGKQKFMQAMQCINNEGNNAFLFIPGGNWYLKIPHIPEFDSNDYFDNEGNANAIMDSSRKVEIQRWFPGWETVWMCPHTDYIKNTVIDMFLKCLDLGVSAVQIDNFPCSDYGGLACYNKGHGHPTGYGSWWSKAYIELLKSVREKANNSGKDIVISAEGICEVFIPFLDMYDNRNSNREFFGHIEPGEPANMKVIPLFNYVYNQYIASYSSAFLMCNRPEMSYWIRSFAKAVVEGVIPTGGWYFKKPEKLNKATMDFYNKLIKITVKKFWKYLMFGNILRPPVIDVPRIKIPFLRLTEDFDRIDEDKLLFVEDDAVLYSKWLGHDRDICFIFINISDKEIGFSAMLEGENGIYNYNVYKTEDTNERQLMEGYTTPCEFRINLKPLSIVLFELKKE